MASHFVNVTARQAIFDFDGCVHAEPALASRLTFAISSAVLLVVSLFLSPLLSAIPQSSSPPAASNQNTQPSQVIRTTTRLVQVSVVVQNKDGIPITGLKAADFSLLDNGRPQKIAFFSANTPAAARVLPLPPHIFTNRTDLKGQDPGATIVILFDTLNTDFEDQSFARQQVLQFLRSFKPQDHVAIFALTDNLLLLHGFTEDAAALSSAVDRFSPRLLAAFDASHPTDFHIPGLENDPFFTSFESHVNNANGQMADLRIADRFRITYSALVAIANYVGTIPGHKSLVWISGGIPIQIGLERIGVADRENFSLANAGVPGAIGDMGGLARELNRANMAIYPVDVHGIDVNDSPTAFFLRQDLRDTFRLLADRTGGKAFYETNDVARAIGSAFEDGRYTYTLGFYPDHGQWDGKFRDISIHLAVQGAELRYRRGYFALPEKSERETVVNADLHDAAISALDATDLGITVFCETLPPVSAHVLQVRVGVNPRQFLLQEKDNLVAGGLDLVFLQKDSNGIILAAEKQHVEVKFNQQEYESLFKTGLVLQRRLTIDPSSTEIRVLIRDEGSGSVGSVTVPLSKIL
jgi:VWFA-related protein